MSAHLTLGKSEHLDRFERLIAAFHAEMDIPSTETSRQDGIIPLLEGSPHGAAYLIGPPRAPIGYAVICFGWSVEFGGLDGFLDELYIRPGVRGRGIASEVLHALPRALAGAGLKALHLEVDRKDEKTQRLYARSGFATRDKYVLMTRVL